MTHNVFVYGTLKRGGRMHAHWLTKAEFVGRAELHGHVMLNFGPFPAITGPVPGGHVIHGEVFRVTAHELAGLDACEGHPRFYQRTMVTLADGTRAWAYLNNEATEAFVAGDVNPKCIIESGVWPVGG